MSALFFTNDIFKFDQNPAYWMAVALVEWRTDNMRAACCESVPVLRTAVLFTVILAW